MRPLKLIKRRERPPQKIPDLTDKEVHDAIFLPHPDKAPGVGKMTFRAWRYLFPVVED